MPPHPPNWAGKRGPGAAGQRSLGPAAVSFSPPREQLSPHQLSCLHAAVSDMTDKNQSSKSVFSFTENSQVSRNLSEPRGLCDLTASLWGGTIITLLHQ